MHKNADAMAPTHPVESQDSDIPALYMRSEIDFSQTVTRCVQRRVWILRTRLEGFCKLHDCLER